MDGDLTVEILKQVRDGVNAMHRDLRDRSDGLGGRIGGTEQRVDRLGGDFRNVEADLRRVNQELSDRVSLARRIADDQARHLAAFHSA